MSILGKDQITPEDRKTSEKYLRNLIASVPGVQAAAIVSSQGIPIATFPPSRSNESQVAAMIAVLQNLGKKAAQEWLKGDIEQVFIGGTKGYFAITRRGQYALLAVSATKDVKLGLLFDEMNE